MRTPASEVIPERGDVVVLGRDGERVAARVLDACLNERSATAIDAVDLPRWVSRIEERAAPRWVWNDTPQWYSTLLAAGVRVARCHDLRLVHIVLRHSALVTDARALRDANVWNAPPFEERAVAPGLFDLDTGTSSLPRSVEAATEEYRRQREAISNSRDPNRLRTLSAAESAGALVASEMQSAGLPWRREEHARILDQTLGARDATGTPAHVAHWAREVRAALGDPTASLDSQPKLLRALHRAGVLVESTSRWELAEHAHPVIAPLVEYKKLMRLQSANGWAWLDEWVHDGRFRPVYVPSGVVTGRWASSGGGALQIPRLLREAVRADEGWMLVVADVAQLEPRVLAAMSADRALAQAARGRDLYSGIVASGAVGSRPDAKIAMLGAMYGATTGESGRLVPRLRRAYPQAMALVDDAARTGEDGGTVSTWLGRSSPPPSEEWSRRQSEASETAASDIDRSFARRSARDRGRFTRNFVVQGTAAEWASVWLAELRARLIAMPAVPDADAARRSGAVFATRPHIAFFLHDEVIVHAPAPLAEVVAAAVQDAASAAGRRLFGDFPLDFPLDAKVSDTAAKE